jgi:hypothetical protein
VGKHAKDGSGRLYCMEEVQKESDTHLSVFSNNEKLKKTKNCFANNLPSKILLPCFKPRKKIREGIY